MKGKNQSAQIRAIHAKGTWSQLLPFTPSNIKRIENTEGIYELFDKNKKKVEYVGVSDKRKYSGLRHRLESYNETDDFVVHPTKKDLRDHIKFFRIKYEPIPEARSDEHMLKQNTKYNMDNKKAMENRHA